MLEVSQACCEVCGCALDGEKVLCVGCSKQGVRRRRAALQQRYLDAVAADEGAERALVEMRDSEVFVKMKEMQEMRTTVEESRARVAALKEYLDMLREKNASSLSPEKI